MLKIGPVEDLNLMRATVLLLFRATCVATVTTSIGPTDFWEMLKVISFIPGLNGANPIVRSRVFHEEEFSTIFVVD